MTDWTPHINWMLYPEEERDSARHLGNQIRHLRTLLEYFEDAVELLAFLKSARSASQAIRHQPVIPARDAVLTVYHFRATLYSLKAQLASCPSLASQADAAMLQSAIDRFKGAFPNAINLRHSVGHSTDTMYTPAHIEKHRVPDLAFIQGQLEGTDFRGTYEGIEMFLSVSAGTAQELREIMEQAFDAFRPVSFWPP